MKIFVIIVVALIILFILTNLRTAYSSHQTEFLSGKVPSPLPDGFLSGRFAVPFSWAGKRFSRVDSSGMNVFNTTEGTTREAYPFKTYTGKGIKDSSLDVFKIDYDIPQNRFYARPILDELVEIAPGKYIGKIHYRLPLGLTLSLGYFYQEK